MPNGCLKLKLKTGNFKLGDIMEDDSYDLGLGVAPRTADNNEKPMYRYSPCLTRIEVGDFCFRRCAHGPSAPNFYYTTAQPICQ